MLIKFRTYDSFEESKIYGTELYDYQTDPNETRNVVKDNNYSKISVEMKNKMVAYFHNQEKKLKSGK